MSLEGATLLPLRAGIQLDALVPLELLPRRNLRDRRIDGGGHLAVVSGARPGWGANRG